MAQHKVAVNREEARKLQEKQEGKPYGWIQWQGTDVCMDFYCKCGHRDHIDAEFVFNIKCGKCGTVYQCNPHIEFIELEQSDDECIFETK